MRAGGNVTVTYRKVSSIEVSSDEFELNICDVFCSLTDASVVEQV